MNVIHLPTTHPASGDAPFDPWLDGSCYHEQLGVGRVVGIHRVVGVERPVSYSIRAGKRIRVVRELSRHRPRGSLLRS